MVGFLEISSTTTTRPRKCRNSFCFHSSDDDAVLERRKGAVTGEVCAVGAPTLAASARAEFLGRDTTTAPEK